MIFVLFVTQFGASFLGIVMPIFFSVLFANRFSGSSLTWASVAFVAPLLVGAIMAPYWGKLADYYDRRLLLVRAHLGLALAATISAFARTPLELVLALTLQGALGGTYAAGRALLLERSLPAHREKALFLFEVSPRLAMVVMPLLVAFGVLGDPTQKYFQWGAIVCLINALAVALLPKSKLNESEVKIRSRVAPRPAWKFTFNPEFATFRKFAVPLFLPAAILAPYLTLLFVKVIKTSGLRPEWTMPIAVGLVILPHFGLMSAFLFKNNRQQSVSSHSKANPLVESTLLWLQASFVVLLAFVSNILGLVVSRLFYSLFYLGNWRVLHYKMLSTVKPEKFGEATGELDAVQRYIAMFGAALGGGWVWTQERFGWPPKSIFLFAGIPFLFGIAFQAWSQSIKQFRLKRSRLGVENLLNCWIREGGNHKIHSDRVEILLTSSTDPIYFPIKDQTLLGDIRIDENRLGGLDAFSLAQRLALEVSRMPGSTPNRVPDWKEHLRDSLRVQRKIDSLVSIDEIGKEPNFVKSEQAFYSGHRFHPSPKSRLGFSGKDLSRYSPEWQPRFQLTYWSVPKSVVVQRGEQNFLDSFQTRLMAPAERIFLPIHPWQANHLSRSSEKIKRALKSGEIVELKEHGPFFFPTASVRTLYQPEWDVFAKTSLDVRITNCIRRNLPSEMETLIHVRSLVSGLPLRLKHSNSFRIMDEPGSLDLHPSFGVFVGCIFRDGIALEKSDHIEPLLAASLFGESELSVSRLRQWTKAADDPVGWFRMYLDCLIGPLIEIYFQFGVMFEPHLQNVLVGIREGRPVKVLLRDLDNVKLVAGSKAAESLKGVGAAIWSESVYESSIAWKRFTYCLIVNHLSEAIASLARVDESKESQIVESLLWQELRAVLLKHSVPESLVELPLWAKKNFFTRLTRTADRDAPFSELINPMLARPFPIAESRSGLKISSCKSDSGIALSL